MKILLILLSFISVYAYGESQQRNYIRVIGSATLYPFITVSAEKFGTEFAHTPVVESTGTGGGFHLLCSGNDSLKYPDIVAASRPIEPSETKLCAENGIYHLKEIKLGYGGIAIAQAKNARSISLSAKQLFLAISKKVLHEGKLVNNFYTTWQQIDPSLPNHKIEIYGPSYTSGTRDVIISTLMKDISAKTIREDGHYIAMPEDNNLIIQKLVRNTQAIGVIGFSFLEENPQIKPIAINEVFPSHKAIISGEYILSRPLFIYVNMDHIGLVPGLAEFVKEITSKKSIGQNGYLTQIGLITE